MSSTDAFESQRLRRDSSPLEADRADFKEGSNVIAPPRYITDPSRNSVFHSNNTMVTDPVTSDTSSSYEGDSSQVTTPLTTPTTVTSSDFAFAFDIDGVLVRGGQPIPEAVQAMKYINGENPYGVKV